MKPIDNTQAATDVTQCNIDKPAEQTRLSGVSHGVNLALLDGQLLSRGIERGAFIERLSALGIPRSEATDKAEKYLGIARNQTTLRQNLKRSYDYIVIGSGAS